MTLNPGIDPVHVDVVGGHVRLGKREKLRDRRNLQLYRYLTTPSGRHGLPPIPVFRTWSAEVVAKLPFGWGMKANDRLGDCTVAAHAHSVQAWTALEGPTVIDPPDSAVENLYWATGTADDGRFCLDILNYVRQTSPFGVEVEAFAEIGRGRHFRKLTMAAIDLFGFAYIGLALPESAQTQTVWKSVRGPSARAGSWGGHCVDLVDYDVHGPTCITWGQPLRMTWGFFERYCDEAYAVLSPAWFSDGKAPSGFDANALRADLKLVVS